MIKTIQNTIETVPMQDINKALRTIGTYAWIGTGLLFVCYGFFIGSITFSIVKQQGIQGDIKSLISSMSKQELAYLNTQKTLTESYASEVGMVPVNVVSFATPKRAFAWNVGH
jgi:hypothetical protein